MSDKDDKDQRKVSASSQEGVTDAGGQALRELLHKAGVPEAAADMVDADFINTAVETCTRMVEAAAGNAFVLLQAEGAGIHVRYIAVRPPEAADKDE